MSSSSTIDLSSDKVGYLFGQPIAHSLAPLLHNTVFQGLNLPWKYKLFESLDMEQFLNLIKEPNCFGSAVTMPHKVAILPHLDDLTPEGRDVGACNTIFFREENGKRIYVGHNTDVVGIQDSFYQNIKNPDSVFHGRPGMVIGGGGAARSAVYALQRLMQCNPIYLINRDKAEIDTVIRECTEKGFGKDLIHVESAEQADGLEGPGAIVACVPDLPPRTNAETQARRVFETMLAKPVKGAILEMCYHPSPYTEIGRLSENAGWQVILGTEAMIYQGIAQDKLWTGKKIEEMPLEKVNSVIAARLGQSHL